MFPMTTQKLIRTIRHAKHIKSWVLISLISLLLLLSVFGYVGNYQDSLQNRANNLLQNLEMARTSCIYSEDFNRNKNKNCLEKLAVVSHELDTSLKDNSYFAYKWQVLLEYQNLKQISAYVINKDILQDLISKAFERLKTFYPISVLEPMKIDDLNDFNRLYFVIYEKNPNT